MGRDLFFEELSLQPAYMVKHACQCGPTLLLRSHAAEIRMGIAIPAFYAILPAHCSALRTAQLASACHRIARHGGGGVAKPLQLLSQASLVCLGIAAALLSLCEPCSL